MNKKYFYCLLSMSLCTLIGCRKNGANEIYFTKNIDIVRIDTIEKYELSGTCFVSDMIGIEGIELTNNYIVLTSQDTDSLINIYNLNGNKIKSFGKRGQGPNDFINTILNGQHEDGYIWINDVSMALLKRINIPASLATTQCVIDKHFYTRPRSANAFVLNDSSIISEEMTDDNYVLKRVTQEGETILDEKMYEINIRSPFSYYKSSMCINEGKNVLCAAMHSINQVNFYNYSTKKRKSVSLGNVNTRDEIVTNNDTGIEDWVYYAFTYATPHFFYSLYLNQSYEDAYEKEKKVEIHIFTPTGNLVRIIKLDKYILRFAIDNNDKTLYGIYDDSTIYKYNLL